MRNIFVVSRGDALNPVLYANIYFGDSLMVTTLCLIHMPRSYYCSTDLV